MSKTLLKIVLILTGTVVVILGINIGFGGIATLGLQGTSDFFDVTNQSVFDIRDNHVRFGGGIVIAIGLAMVFTAFRLNKAFPILLFIALMFMAGGIARLTAFHSDLIFSADILPSLLIELFGFPALAYWSWLISQSGH